MIDSFTGKYRFLSNFYPCRIEFEGIEYPSTEHAYQAAKADDFDMKIKIASAVNPAEAKRLGNKCKLYSNWDDIKVEIMKKILRLKFEIPTHRKELLDTGNKKLIEGNQHNDTFWGICDGIGENNLGKLLMEIRQEIKEETINDMNA